MKITRLLLGISLIVPFLVFAEERQRVLVVTGASSGIGKALVTRFAKERDYKVYGTTRNASLTGLRPEGYTLVQMDPAITSSVENAFAQILKSEEKVDLLINNAAYMVLGSVESIDPDSQLLDMFNVNVVGYVRATRAVIPAMRRSGKGRIINISSTQAFEPRGLQESYSATRAAIESLSLGQASYLKDYGIDVLVYEPGATRTNVVLSSKTGLHSVSGDKTQNYMPVFVEVLGKRIAEGMPADMVAEDIFSLTERVSPDFRTQASTRGTKRAGFVYRDATGNELLKLLQDKFDQFAKPLQ